MGILRGLGGRNGLSTGLGCLDRGALDPFQTMSGGDPVFALLIDKTCCGMGDDDSLFQSSKVVLTQGGAFRLTPETGRAASADRLPVHLRSCPLQGLCLALRGFSSGAESFEREPSV